MPETIVTEETSSSPEVEGTLRTFAPSDTLDDTQKAALSTFLSSELSRVLDGDERATFLENLRTYRRMRIAEPEAQSRSDPWPNASNVVTPVTAQKVNVVWAKLISMFQNQHPFWGVETADARYVDHAKALGKFLNALAKNPHALDIARKNRVIFYEVASLGTQVVRVPFLVDEVPIKTKDPVSGATIDSKRIVHNGPAIVPIRLEDFVGPSEFVDIERMPWCGVCVSLTNAELKLRAASGVYDAAAVQVVLTSYVSEFSEAVREERERQGLSTAPSAEFEEMRTYEVFELFVRYDADGDGIAEDLKVWFERKSGTFLRSEVNLLGRRDLAVLRYFEVPYSFYAIGICQMLKRLQTENDFWHNTRVDNATLQLTPVYKRRRGSMISKRQTLVPGQFLDLDDINDVVPMAVQDLSGVTYPAENVVRDYADRVSGANDPMSGYADTTLKSGSNAASLMFLAQQGNSVLNAIYDGIERDYDQIGQLVLLQLVANKDLVDLSVLDDVDMAFVNEILAMPAETLPTTFRFTVVSADVSRSDEMKRNNVQAAMQLYSSYGQNALQLMSGMQNVQLPPEMRALAAQLLLGATTFAKDSMELLHIEHVEKLFPDTNALEEVLNGLRSGGNQPPSANAGAPGVQPGAGTGPVGAVSGQ